MSRGDNNWFDEVNEYLQMNQTSFMNAYLTQGAKRVRSDKLGFEVNPCPYCGHDDCFKIRDGFVKCFSAGCVASDALGYIKAVKELVGESNYIHELERFTGIEFKRQEVTPERKKEIDKEKRLDDMYNTAVEYYHQELLTRSEQALRKQTDPVERGGRGHTVESLKHFKVGFCDVDTWANLSRYLSGAGYDRDEIGAGRKMLWVPPGSFVYPCFDHKDRLRRINTKLLFRSCYGKKTDDGRRVCDFHTFDLSKDARNRHEDETGHTMVSNGYSNGEKDAFFVARPDFKNRRRFKYALLVEGENDAISAWEALRGTSYEKLVLVVAIGGSIGKEKLSEPAFAYLGERERLYEAFDHDHAGIAYRATFNEVFVDVPYFTIQFGEEGDGDDIDSYLKTARLEPAEVELLFEDAAGITPPEGVCKVHLDPGKPGQALRHTWTASNRRGKVTYQVTGLVGRGGDRKLNGNIEFFHGKKEHPFDIRTGSLKTARVSDVGLNTLRILLVKEIDSYYETFPTDPRDGSPERPDAELLTAHAFSNATAEINRQLALRLLAAQRDNDAAAVDALTNRYKTALGAAKFEHVRKELNALLNSGVSLDSNAEYPRIQLSSHFDTERDEALFYYVKNVQDGDSIAEVPCIITNKKTETRLDLLKRKEKTHLLLVEGHYQIPSEMESAPLPLELCSLQPDFVERWKNDQIKDEDIDIAKLVREIESVLTDVYYFRDPRVSKVLALWTYGSYYYMLFGVYPYIELSGRRGSGKSTIDKILSKMALNGRMSASITPAAIYRMLDLVGGTLVLDEMESIADKAKNDMNDIGGILKSGYSNSGGKAYRFDPDVGEIRGFVCYGPKVISSINGMDEVLRDRAVMITTSPAPENVQTDLVRIDKFDSGERRRQVRSIASRCAISAMTHFQKVNKMFEEVHREGESNRLSQILVPLQTIAAFADPEYEAALMDYYETEIRASKQYTFENTLEGKMVFALRRIAKELVTPDGDLTFTTEFLDPENEPMYSKRILYDKDAKTFEVTTLHLKLLIDGMGDVISTREEINGQARLLFGSHSDAKARTKRTTYTIKNLYLSRMFNGSPKISINKFTFDIEPFLDEEGLRRLNDKETVQMGIHEGDPPF